MPITLKSGMSIERVISIIEFRRDSIASFLDDHAPYTSTEQQHLDARTPEQAYWHHGYQAALADILTLINRNVNDAQSNEGTSERSLLDG